MALSRLPKAWRTAERYARTTSHRQLWKIGMTKYCIGKFFFAY